MLKKSLKYFLILVLFLSISSITIYEFFPGVICKAYKYRSFSKTKLEVKKIKIDGEAFYYAEGGKGENLIFVHGFQSDMSFWNHYVNAFSNYHIVVIDLPAHGKSPCSKNQKFDLQSLSLTLNDFVEAIHLDKFCLVGTSLGAGVITEYSAKYKDKVSKMILLNPIGIKPSEKDYSEIITRNEKLFFPMSIAELDNLYVYLTGSPFSMGYPIKKYILDRILAKKDIYHRVYSDLVRSRGVENILSSINTPTLLLFGKYDNITRVQDVEIYINKMPKCKAVMVPDGFHILSGKALDKALLEMQLFLK